MPIGQSFGTLELLKYQIFIKTTKTINILDPSQTGYYKIMGGSFFMLDTQFQSLLKCYRWVELPLQQF